MRLLQKALTFDDVLLVPAYSNVLPADTSLKTRLTRNIALNIPLLSAAMIASLAEPAMLMIVFTLALVAGSTQLSTMATYMLSSEVGLRVSLGLALIALLMVAIAENARIPVDNPATHLELTMVHEAMLKDNVESIGLQY